MRFIDLSGQRFGQLLVLHRAEDCPSGATGFMCKCDCGAIKRITASNLRTGTSLSCRHDPGASRRYPKGWGRNSRLHTIWRNMLTRCKTDPLYAGRGIAVCSEWQSYQTFMDWSLANGYQRHLTIDRMDNDKGYFPANCRWATWHQQARNQRKTVMLTAFGETKSICDWAEDPRVAVKASIINYRLKSGRYTPESALTVRLRVIRKKGQN